MPQVPRMVQVIAVAFAIGAAVGCFGSTMVFAVARVGRAAAGVTLCDR